jgi:hypothetical protein
VIVIMTSQALLSAQLLRACYFLLQVVVPPISPQSLAPLVT